MAPPLSINALRAKAAKGELLSLEETRFFIEATRKSYTAAALAVGAKKGAKPQGETVDETIAKLKTKRTAKPPPPPIDFF